MERMQDMRDWVQANHTPCYWEGAVAKIAKEHIQEAICNSWLEYNLAL
jgi:hypothetical protein